MMNLSELDVVLDAYKKVSSKVNYPQGTLLGFNEKERHSFKIDKAKLNKKRLLSRKYEEVNVALEALSVQVPYAIGGDVKLEGKYFLSIKNQVTGNEDGGDFHEIGDIKNLSIKSLLQNCDPSPYGDLVNRETKVDPEVRLGMECPAARIKIETLDRQKNRATGDLSSHIRMLVQHALLKDQKTGGIDLLLHKLNVYSENGHFQPHTDTPTHDPSLFLGTVVVCLPSAHEGGDLIVRHAGQETVFNFADKSNNTEVIQYAAFYGDCEHQVQRVTAGHRIVLTYSILKSDTQPHETRYMSKYVQTIAGPYKEDERIPRILNDVYKSFENGPLPGEYVGVFLAHDYTGSALVAQTLKGADKLLYDFLVEEKQIPVSLIAVTGRTSYQMYEKSDEIPREDRGKVQGEPSFEVRLLEGFGDNRLEAHKTIPNDIPFLTGKYHNVIQVKDQVIPAHHAGNSCEADSTDRIYIQCAMIVGLPYPPEVEVKAEDVEVSVEVGGEEGVNDLDTAFVQESDDEALFTRKGVKRKSSFVPEMGYSADGVDVQEGEEGNEDEEDENEDQDEDDEESSFVTDLHTLVAYMKLLDDI